MCENVNPKIIVDDDFLDLRNVQSKPFSRRPMSAYSTTKESSSINTHEKASTVKDARSTTRGSSQGKASTAREVLPGLQRLLLNTYSKKNSSPFGYKKNSRGNSQPVDCRFRRKVENKMSTSRSESSLHENKDSRQETLSDASLNNHSSECGKNDECLVQAIPPESPSEEKKCERMRVKTDGKPFLPVKTKEVKIEEFVENKTQGSYEKLRTNDCEKITEIPIKLARQDSMRKPDLGTIGDKNRQNSKTADQGQIQMENLNFDRGFHPIPTFKKCWTVPSLPVIKDKLSWTRHYNALCTKVDRQTYEFDTDDTISESEELLSAYSSISRNNYMNLIFCLGCLCGIFLIGGILTASEIHADYFRQFESEDGMIEFFYYRISNTLRLILNVFQQIITLPSTKLFRTTVEPTEHCSVFTKYVPFISE